MDTGITRLDHLDVQSITQRGAPIGGGNEVLFDGAPVGANVAPTLGHIKTIIDGVANSLISRTLRHSAILQCVTRQLYKGPITGSEAIPMNGGTVNIDTFRSYTEAHPVSVLASNRSGIERLADRIGAQMAADIDFELSNVSPFFSVNAPLGTAGSALSNAAHLETTADRLKASGQPVFIVLNPNAFTANSTVERLLTVARQSSGPVRNKRVQNMASATAAPTPTVGNVQDYTVLLSQEIRQTGTGPITTHNIGFTPNAISFASAIQDRKTGANTYSRVVSQDGVSIQVYCENSGSGNQTIIATCFYGVAAGVIANGQVIRT